MYTEGIQNIDISFGVWGVSVGAHNNQQLLACPPFVTVTIDFVIPSAATLNWCRRPFA